MKHGVTHPKCLFPNTGELRGPPSLSQSLICMLAVTQKLQSGCLGSLSRLAVLYLPRQELKDVKSGSFSGDGCGWGRQTPSRSSLAGGQAAKALHHWVEAALQGTAGGACLAPLGSNMVSFSFQIQKPLPRATGWAQRLAGSIILMQNQQPCAVECEPAPKMPTSLPTDPG